MLRPARALAVSGAVLVGVLVGAAAYTASGTRSPDETRVGPAVGVVLPDDVVRADYIVTTTSNATPVPTTPLRPTTPAETTRPPAPVEAPPVPG